MSSCLGYPYLGHSMAAIVNLNTPAHTVHWHFITLSVANVIVLVVMLIVFVLAILLPFPGYADPGHVTDRSAP
jgi:hypothetical protein